MNSTKEGYQDEFKCFCFALAVILVFLSPDATEALLKLIPDFAEGIGQIAGYAAFLAFAYATCITLDKLVPTRMKDWIIFPHVKDWGLWKPGCYIFSKLSNGEVSDSRIDYAEALKVYAEEMEMIQGCANKKQLRNYENRRWYRLLQRHRESRSILFSNVDFLYCRDACCLSFFFLMPVLIINLVGQCVCGSRLFSIVTISLLSLCFVIGWISAHSKARRLVINVIAVDMATKDEKNAKD